MQPTASHSTRPLPPPISDGTWSRRVLTLPALAILASGLWSLLPALLVIAVVVDLTVGHRQGTLRTLLLAITYVAADVLGLLAAGGLWVARYGLGLLDDRQWHDAHRSILRTWTSTLWWVASRLFDLRLEVEGADCVSPGPILVLERHASLGDTLLGTLLIEVPHHLDVRYAVKSELLWEPAFDVIGQRLGVCFVHRGTRDGAAERARVAALGHDLGPGEAVLIYPEGTRFTEAKRQRRIQEARARGDADAEARAASYTHVLAPHRGGPLALLAESPGVDVVVLAHAGLERGVTLVDLVRGAPVGTVARVKLWRVPAAGIPEDPAARAAWLDALWLEVDAEVARLSQEAAAPAP